MFTTDITSTSKLFGVLGVYNMGIMNSGKLLLLIKADSYKYTFTITNAREAMSRYSKRSTVFGE